MNKASNPVAKARQRGMTLVEVLVGVAIGMIGMLVIFQTVSVWDARTKGTTAGADAQVTAAIAMYNLERDVRLAGMGFGRAGASEMGCALSGYDLNASGPIGPFPLAPVVITDNNAAGTPDVLTVLYGVSTYYMEHDSIDAVPTPHSVHTNNNRVGFKPGDLAALTTGAADCYLVQITDDATTADPKTMSFSDTGNYPNFYTGTNTPVRFNSASGVPATVSNAYSLGPNPRRNIWRVVNGTLGFSSDLPLSPFFGVAEGVVDMKAIYGYDADGDNRIANAEWTKAVPVNWTNVLAVRVALLVRSRNFERPGQLNSAEQNYVAPNPQYHDTPTTQVDFVMKNVDGTPDTAPLGDPNNWRQYRYTVLEKVIPLRNVIWGE